MARAAREAGMRAVVLKSHNVPTAARAQQVQQQVPGIQVFGSINLNLHVGGLNAIAVEAAIKYGARQVWFPTVDAANHAGLVGGETGQHGKGLEVHELLRLIAQANILLNPGHLSYAEMEPLIAAARARIPPCRRAGKHHGRARGGLEA